MLKYNSFCLNSLFLAICSTVLACSSFEASNYRAVLSNYEVGSSGYHAANFLLGNIDDKFAIKIRYLSADSIDYSDFAGTYSGVLSHEQVIDSLGLKVLSEKIFDTIKINPIYLTHEINEAIRIRSNGIFKYRNEYSEEIFYNYILPYRVGYEEVNDWRKYLCDRYTSFLKSFRTDSMSIKDIVQVIKSEQFGATNFALTRKEHVAQISVNQTVQEFIKFRVPFGCEDYATIMVYTLRALGIPAAYEKIPYWGKFNNGHAEAAALFEDGKFYPDQFGDSNPFKYQIAKMYRRTFRKQKNRFSEIRKAGQATYNIPAYFNCSDLVDVTKERTDVSDVNIILSRFIERSVFYICVYNNGKWVPVEWAKADQRSKSLKFSDMGRNILYIVAYCKEGQMFPVTDPFLLTPNGHLSKLNNSPENTELSVSYFDRHKPIAAGTIYSLFVWDVSNQVWEKIDTRKAIYPNLSFSKLSQNSLYKLEEMQVRTMSEPVRPFTVKGGDQIWW